FLGQMPDRITTRTVVPAELGMMVGTVADDHREAVADLDFVLQEDRGLDRLQLPGRGRRCVLQALAAPLAADAHTVRVAEVGGGTSVHDVIAQPLRTGRLANVAAVNAVQCALVGAKPGLAPAPLPL